MDAGAWAEAEEILELARESGQADVAWIDGSVLGVLVKLRTWQGRWAEARTLLEESEQLAETASEPMFVHTVQRGLAEIELMDGRPEAAIRRLETTSSEHAHEDISAAYSLPILARAYLQIGDVDRARSAADPAVRLLGELPGAAPSVLRVHAAMEIAAHDTSSAEAALQEARRLARASGSPFEEALALLDLGVMRLGNDDPAGGTELVKKALSTLRRLGAASYVQRAEEALAVIGNQ
jgi:ATP/maltotriose-dependent transcriptional regulator MalT